MLKKFAPVFLLIAIAATLSFAATSEVVKFPAKDVQGTGPLPYNYRIIDGHIHAGGHPLNPATEFGNSDEQALSILNYLKSKGVENIIDLENTRSIQDRYQALLDKAGMTRIHIPLNGIVLPTRDQWASIKRLMKGPVYIHCKWGADRTGMAIARYLVEEKGYTSDEAYKAVLTGGSHAGAMGGFKKNLANIYLRYFIYHGPMK
ncbi:MAG TPA: hypothetical protein VMD02_05230 [Candidatus Omnitrophota bacterium]|nr:hypothetical protein [Candidatus Omnitrophota bacterium]